MIRHHDIAVDAKAETAPNVFERSLEDSLRRAAVNDGRRW